MAHGNAQRQDEGSPEAARPLAWLGGEGRESAARRAALAATVGGLTTWHGAGDGLVVVDQASLTREVVESALATLGARALLVADPSAPRAAPLALLARFGLAHLVGGSGDTLARELAHVQRMHDAGGDIFGMARYFAPGTRLETRVVRSAASVKDTVEELLARLDFTASFASAREFLQLTANELVTNAVYHAPVDGAARPKFASVDRREKPPLAEAEAVVVTMAADETQVGVGVLDRFGRLARETVARAVAKEPEGHAFLAEEGRGGAGVGLCLAYHSASQLAFHVEPGRRLEALCLLERSKRFRDYKARVPSFHWFEAKAR